MLHSSASRCGHTTAYPIIRAVAIQVRARDPGRGGRVLEEDGAPLAASSEHEATAPSHAVRPASRYGALPADANRRVVEGEGSAPRRHACMQEAGRQRRPLLAVVLRAVQTSRPCGSHLRSVADRRPRAPVTQFDRHVPGQSACESGWAVTAAHATYLPTAGT